MEPGKLGFGLLRLPKLAEDKDQIDIRHLEKMVDLFLEKGFNYFDTSYVYLDGKSEPSIRAALVERYPRDAFLLASKLPTFIIKKPEEMERIFHEQLERCGVTYFDYYLMHNIFGSNYDGVIRDCGMFAFGKKLRESGYVRHLGMSFHDSPEELDRILAEHPEIEFVQITFNYYDQFSESIQARRCYETIRRHGRKVVVMGPVKGGMLADPPENVRTAMQRFRPQMSPSAWAVRYAASFEGVMTVLSGMSTLEQVADNITGMEDGGPLTADERSMLEAAACSMKQKRAIDCMQCGLCDAVCPKHIRISDTLSMYNSDMLQPDELFTVELLYYKTFKAQGRTADICDRCGRCAGVCPSGLDVLAELNKAAEFFEKNGY